MTKRNVTSWIGFGALTAVTATAIVASPSCNAPMFQSLDALKAANAFVDVSARLGAAGAIKGWGGLAAFDYDNDGDIDLFVANERGTPNRLFQNDGNAGFTDVASQAGVALVDENCFVCATGDFNNDGWLDLLIGRQKVNLPPGAEAGSLMLLNNGPNSGGVVTFSLAGPAATQLTSTAPAMAFAVGDLDRDGLLDIVIGRYDTTDVGLLLPPIYNSQPNELWRCSGIVGGVPQYQLLTGAGIEGTPQHGFSPETANQTFVPGSLALYLTDVDSDGFLDLFDLHDIPGGVDYFHNNGDLTFTPRQSDLLNKHGGWMGMTGGDYDLDGDLDYFITNVGCDFTTNFIANSVASAQSLPNGSYWHRLLRNDGGFLVDVTAATNVIPSSILPPTNSVQGIGLQAVEFGFGTTWIDSDNSGRLDLYWIGDLISYLQRGLLVHWHGVGRFLHNNADGSFTDRTAERGLFDIPAGGVAAFGEQEAGRALAACDLNADGFLDLIVTNASYLGNASATTRLFLNPGVPGNHWITIRLRGDPSNRFGIGARVRVQAGGINHIGEVLSTTSAFLGLQPQAHFGLGQAASIESIEVQWPSGNVSNLSNIAVNQLLIIDE